MITNTMEAQSKLELINDLFLGFDIMSPSDYSAIVRSGISGEKLKAIIQLTGEKDLIARAIGINSSQLYKSYHVKRLPSQVTADLVETLRVFVRVVNIYNSVSLAKEWIHSQIPALGGQIPANILHTTDGRADVEQILRKLELGDYA